MTQVHWLSWELLSSHREQKLACSFGTTNAWRGRKLTLSVLEIAVCKAELMVRSRDLERHGQPQFLGKCAHIVWG